MPKTNVILNLVQETWTDCSYKCQCSCWIICLQHNN